VNGKQPKEISKFLKGRGRRQEWCGGLVSTRAPCFHEKRAVRRIRGVWGREGMKKTKNTHTTTNNKKGNLRKREKDRGKKVP